MTVRRRFLLVLGVVALIAAACSGGGDTPSASPETTSVEETTTTGRATSTTRRPTTTSSTLKPTTTTSTTLGLGPGEAFLGGTVSGPAGPVEGATVKIERIVGKLVATQEITTGGGGTWQLGSILGGSYRVRASKPPDFGLSSVESFFMAAAERKTIDLKLPAAGAERIIATVIPNPPRLDQTSTLRIQYGTTRFDGQGQVVIAPRPGVVLAMSFPPGINLESPFQSLTDANGFANWQIRCTAEGAKSGTLTIGTGQTPVNLPPCAAAGGGPGTTRRG